MIIIFNEVFFFFLKKIEVITSHVTEKKNRWNVEISQKVADSSKLIWQTCIRSFYLSATFTGFAF